MQIWDNLSNEFVPYKLAKPIVPISFAALFVWVMQICRDIQTWKQNLIEWLIRTFQTPFSAEDYAFNFGQKTDVSFE